MIKFKKNGKKDRFKSKYLDLNFEEMSDEEFAETYRKVYSSILLRGFGGMGLFIVCIVVLVLCGRYLW